MKLYKFIKDSKYIYIAARDILEAKKLMNTIHGKVKFVTIAKVITLNGLYGKQ